MNKLFKRLIDVRGLGEEFLAPKYEKLADPFLLPEMEQAVERILMAVKRNEKVLVYGDYDVDGVTASTVMAETLKLAGISEVEIMLPDRFLDGYGMSPKVIKRAKEGGFSLVVTVDTGSANKNIVQELTEVGIDTIVTDHHECPTELPKAVAVINPKREEYEGFRDLAGVGVAFKVAQALVRRGAIKSGQEKWLLDLVLIGTVCDSMPLISENRIFGVFGLKVLEKTRRAGLIELMRVAGVRKMNSEVIGFQIGPRLNAAGRLESAELALDLIRAKSRAEAAGLAMKLEELNKKRRTEQRAVMGEIEKRGIGGDAVIVETGEWHEGILGIIAGRLVEEYKKPAFALTEVGEGIFKGSGRSFGEFNLADALGAVRSVIIGGGGHAEACGLKVERAKIDEFKAKMNEYYNSLGLHDQERFLKERGELDVSNLEDFSLEFLDEMAKLEPFGEGNKEPIFRLDGAEILEIRKMGAEEQHLGMMVKGREGGVMKLVGFFVPEDWKRLTAGERGDILVRVMENEWNGVRSVEGRILEISVDKEDA